MKEVKSNKFSDIIPLIFIIVFAFFLVNKYNIGIFFSFIIIFFVGLFYILSIISIHSYFLYNDEYLIIRNSLNPFFRKEFLITEIDNLTIRNEAFMGSAIRISFKNGINKTFYCNAKLNELECMVNYIMNVKKIRDE